MDTGPANTGSDDRAIIPVFRLVREKGCIKLDTAYKLRSPYARVECPGAAWDVLQAYLVMSQRDRFCCLPLDERNRIEGIVALGNKVGRKSLKKLSLIVHVSQAVRYITCELACGKLPKRRWTPSMQKIRNIFNELEVQWQDHFRCNRPEGLSFVREGTLTRTAPCAGKSIIQFCN